MSVIQLLMYILSWPFICSVNNTGFYFYLWHAAEQSILSCPSSGSSFEETDDCHHSHVLDTACRGLHKDCSLVNSDVCFVIIKSTTTINDSVYCL